jgi:hypothetical protein
MGHPWHPGCYQGQAALRHPVPYEPVCPCVSSTQILPKGDVPCILQNMLLACRSVLVSRRVRSVATPAGVQAPAAVPVFQVTPGDSTITFHVNASVTIEGTFDQWQAFLTFTSPAVESAVLDVQLQDRLGQRDRVGRDYWDHGLRPEGTLGCPTAFPSCTSQTGSRCVSTSKPHA